VLNALTMSDNNMFLNEQKVCYQSLLLSLLELTSVRSRRRVPGACAASGRNSANLSFVVHLVEQNCELQVLIKQILTDGSLPLQLGMRRDRRRSEGDHSKAGLGHRHCYALGNLIGTTAFMRGCTHRGQKPLRPSTKHARVMTDGASDTIRSAPARRVTIRLLGLYTLMRESPLAPPRAVAIDSPATQGGGTAMSARRWPSHLVLWLTAGTSGPNGSPSYVFPRKVVGLGVSASPKEMLLLASSSDSSQSSALW